MVSPCLEAKWNGSVRNIYMQALDLGVELILIEIDPLWPILDFPKCVN